MTKHKRIDRSPAMSMIIPQHRLGDSDMKRLNYGAMIILTTPFVLIAVVVGLLECVMGSDGATTEFIVKPFLWAYRRKV